MRLITFFPYLIMLNMTACISKMCLEPYIYIIIYVNIDERHITKMYENAKVNHKRNLNLLPGR